MNQLELNIKIKELEDELEFFRGEKSRLKTEFVMETSPSKRFVTRKHEKEAEVNIHNILEALGILKNDIIRESKEEIKTYQEQTNGTNGFAEEMNNQGSNSMNIFISHAESDVQVAELLVNLLLSSLQMADDEIRCTSVPGHKLPFGKDISQLLKNDIQLSPIIIALITKSSLASKWVMFELGASWALNKTVIPIIGPNLTHKNLPGPLSSNPCIQIGNSDAPSTIRDALSQISSELGIKEKTGGKPQTNLDRFISTFREKSDQKVSSDDGSENITYKVIYIIKKMRGLGAKPTPREIAKKLDVDSEIIMTHLNRMHDDLLVTFYTSEGLSLDSELILGEKSFDPAFPE